MAHQETLTLAGVELSPEFPFMNAPGSVNGSGEENFMNDFMDIVRAPGTVAMIGTLTVPYKEGNEATYGGPVHRYVPGTGLMYNSMGLPNLGSKRFKELYPELAKIAHDHDKKLAASLGPLSSNPGEEWVQLAEEALEGGVDIIEFNAGCPNIYDADGKPKTVLSLVPDVMGEALLYVQYRLGSDFASGVKISPTPVESFSRTDVELVPRNLIRRQAETLNALAIAKYVAFFNTFGGQVPADENGTELPLSVPGGAGGVSGPGVADAARVQTEILLDYLDKDKEIVVAGGINTGEELFMRVHQMDSHRRVKLGSAVTALWQAPSMGAGATRLAEEYAALR